LYSQLNSPFVTPVPQRRLHQRGDRSEIAVISPQSFRGARQREPGIQKSRDFSPEPDSGFAGFARAPE
jgi:hypothetical protein